MQRPSPSEFDRAHGGWSEDLLRRMDRRRIAAAFFCAVFLHASLALGFVSLQSEPIAPPGEMVITIDLAPAMVSEAAEAAPAEAAESAPVEETPPEPETPQEIVEEVKPEPLPEEPRPEEPVEPEPEVVEEEKVEPPPPAEKAEVVVPKPKPKPQPKPKPKPKSKPQPKPQAAQAASTTRAQRAEIGGSGARASPTEINRYSGKVRAAIERKKSRPSSAGSASGIAHVSFTITRSGAVTAVRLTRSSGNAALDGAARAAVLNASIPPIPDNLPGTINIGVPIRFAPPR